MAGPMGHAARLPVACVEGWSQEARWRGVRLRDLLEEVGAPAGAAVRVRSLQRGGYSSALLNPAHARDPDTLLALELNGAHCTPTTASRCGSPSRASLPSCGWASSPSGFAAWFATGGDAREALPGTRQARPVLDPGPAARSGPCATSSHAPRGAAGQRFAPASLQWCRSPPGNPERHRGSRWVGHALEPVSPTAQPPEGSAPVVGGRRLGLGMGLVLVGLFFVRLLAGAVPSIS
jgi:DMSO/TMAO reductase YedYZ molybdopterin-dependent catalytic subunit